MRDGIPLLDGAVANFIVNVTDIHPAGDHTLYLGQVEHFESRDGRPLLFYAGRYHHLRALKPPEWNEPETSLFSFGGFDPKSIK